MTTREFLEMLKASDIHIRVEGDRLRCDAPQGIMTEVLKEKLSDRKPEILSFLRAGSAVNTSLVPIQPKGSRLPFIGIGGHNGDVFCYVRLAQHLGEDQPFYAIQPPGIEGDGEPLSSVSALASHYADSMEKFLPGGPYMLGGYCAGGTVAFETARLLRSRGGDVRLLVLFGTPCPTVYLLRNQVYNTLRYLRDRILYHLRVIKSSNSGNQIGYLRDRIRIVSNGILSAIRKDNADNEEEGAEAKGKIARATMIAVRAYRPEIYPGRVHLFTASEAELTKKYNLELDWGKFAGGGLMVNKGPEGCTGDNMLRDPFAEINANRLRELLDSVLESTTKTTTRSPITTCTRTVLTPHPS